MASAVNVRELVMEILLAVTRDGEYSHIALHNVLSKYQYLDKKDRAFITRTAEGTLERMIEIDYIIDQFSKVKVNKMKPVIRVIIRSAVYQMKYMDSVPNSAVCNEAVKLAGKKGFVNLKSFVNGVLRNIDRNLDKIVYPESDPVLCLSVQYSMPAWILSQWLSVYEQPLVEEMLLDFMRVKPTSIRCNLLKNSSDELIRKLEQEGVTAEKSTILPYALLISGYDYLGGLKTFQAGDFQVQDISSMMAAEWAAPKEGDRIIDVCAAPGGKALHLAEMLHGTGFVQARDLSEHKVELIRENIVRMGAEHIEAVVRDACVPDEAAVDTADIVMADLPCSGLGVLGKKTDLKYKMSKEQQEELVNLQQSILSVVNRYVKPGGKLIYSTCTIHCRENEENARWFIRQYPEFTLLRDRQMLPGRDGGDGFYIAEFRKEEHV